MAKQPFACGECNRILPDPENKNDVIQCKHCPNAPVTTDWQGYVIIPVSYTHLTLPTKRIV